MIGKLLWHKISISRIEHDVIELIVPFVMVDKEYFYISDAEEAVCETLKRKGLSYGLTKASVSRDLSNIDRIRLVISGLSHVEADKYEEYYQKVKISRFKNHRPKPGDMVEYGWYDVEIEEEINRFMKASGCGREDAIITVFNNA